MLRQMRRIKDLRELTIRATDGDIGKLEDLYFDDHTWSVRYLVVNTGSWLLGRRVLLAPVSVSGFEDSAAVMQIGLTREEVRNSPPVDTQKPISRQYEEEYYRYYGWVPYWGAGAVMGPYPPPPRAIARVSKNEEVPASEIRQTHLRATSEVTGYYVEALDGEIGHVEDLVVDDRDWVVSYFEVDTRNWWAGKKVLVSRTWISNIDWLERKVSINLQRSIIRSAPEYDPHHVISRDYELKLFEHYSTRGRTSG